MSEINATYPMAGGIRMINRPIAWSVSDPKGALSILFLVALMVVSLFAPLLAPYSPTEMDYNSILEGPSLVHLLGTDDLGRDVLSRLMFGTPASLGGSILAVATAAALGIPVGMFAGLSRPFIDNLIGRVLDVFLAFPAMLLAVAVTGMLGAGLTNGMFAIGLVFSPIVARLMRAQTLIVRNAIYVEAARMFGGSKARLILRHILPNAIQPVIVRLTLLMSVGLLAESSLSFVGLGVAPPAASWGSMLSSSFPYMETAPFLIMVPGLAIVFTSLAFITLGESLRRALDPTNRER